MQTDSELLARYAATRDEAAFAELARRHAAMVYRVCLRTLRDPHEAEDAAQAAFVVLARKASSLRDSGDLIAWLHGVARRAALRLARDRARRGRHEEEYAMLTVAEPPTELPAENQGKLLGELDRELAALPARQRQAVVLRYLEGRSESEAAGMLGCAVGTLSSQASKGLARLRERLARREKALSSAAFLALLGAEAGAGVSESLLPSVLAVPKLAAIGAAAGAGTKAVVLAEGVMKAMFWTKVSTVAAVVLVVAAGLVNAPAAYRALAGDSEDTQRRATDSSAPRWRPPELRRVELPYAILMTNVDDEQGKTLRNHLDQIQIGLLNLAGRVPAELPEKCVIYYCLTRQEQAQAKASVLGLRELPPDSDLFGSCVDGKPLRIFSSEDTGSGSAGWGFTFYGIKRDWERAPRWMFYGVVRIFVPTSGLKSRDGREVVDRVLFCAQSSLQRGESFSLALLFGEKVTGKRTARPFVGEEVADEWLAEEVVAATFIRWLNHRALLPQFYQGMRDGGTPQDVLEKLCGKPLDAVEKEMLAWLRSYPEAKLIRVPSKKESTAPPSLPVEVF